MPDQQWSGIIEASMRKPKTSYISVTDQFCGAGGSSLGAIHALGSNGQIVLALNHNKIAIETHATNFPTTMHVRDEMHHCDPRNFPTTDILITSPECTNHSLAKGVKRRNQGQLKMFEPNTFDPDEERSRATMWDVPRFAEYHNYRIIIVENVVDARHWRMFDAWIMAMSSLDYLNEIVYFNSMFAHPTPQSRDRMYAIFWKKGQRKPDLKFTPTAWCAKCEKNVASVQAWKTTKKMFGKYGPRNQYVYRCPHCTTVVTPYYYCAANAIDWSLQGERIGDRKFPLKPRTIERIEHGLRKFGKQAQWVQVDHSNSLDQSGKPITDPFGTQTTRQVVALMTPFMMQNQGDKYMSRDVTQPWPTQVASVQPSLITSPIIMRYDGTHQREATDEFPTVTTRDVMAAVIPPYLTSTNYFSDRPVAVDEPFPTQTTAIKLGLTIPPFMFSYYGERPAVHDITDPMVAQTTMGNHAVIVPPFLLNLQRSDNRSREVGDPMNTVMPHENQALVTPPFIAEFRNNQDARGLDESLSTVCAGAGHHGLVMPAAFLANYYGHSTITDMNDPVGTVTTTDRAALVQPQPELQVEDCYFRMLQPHEIGAAMAFPESYKVLGNSRQKVKQYGNAVTPPVMQMLVERCIESLR